MIRADAAYKLYRGDYAPCRLLLGDRRIAGDTVQEQTGNPLTFSGTYRDRFSALSAAGQTAQDGTGTPSPDNVRPLHGATALTVADGAGQRQTIPLPQALYGLPDGTRDEYDAVGGLGTQRVGRIVLSGTESWYKAAIDNTNLAGFGIALTSSGNKSSLCDKLRPADYFTGAEEIYVNTASQVFVRVLKSRLTGWLDGWTDAQKVAAFKTWLTSNPVTVLYALAAPVPISGAPRSVPTFPLATVLSADGGTLTAACKTQ